MADKIVLAGGTGFIGKYITEKFEKLGYEVMIISRQPGYISYQDTDEVRKALEHAKTLINLAGKSVDCRYNEKNKAAIMNSRTETTRLLGEAVSSCEHPPALWINSSTATIYRHAEDRPMTEKDGETGTGFSVDVAEAWEREFFSFSLPQTRQAALRISIVLGEAGGVMGPYTNLVRFGLGGAQGQGNQMFSWIHIEDLYRMLLYIMKHEHLSGVFNAASPHPLKNWEFMMAMRKAMGRSFGLPSPKWLLEIGAVFMRTETELILKSRWVIPERIMQEGFSFKYPTVDKALTDIICPK